MLPDFAFGMDAELTQRYLEKDPARNYIAEI